MTRFFSSALLAAAGVLAAAAAPRAARAQSPVSFGITGGLAAPVGQLGDNVNAGYSVGGLVDLHPVPGPLSIRVEGAYDRFDVKSSVLNSVVDAAGGNLTGNIHFARATGNLIYRLPTAAGIRPYLTAGVGVYSFAGGVTYANGNTTVTQNDNSQTKFGINGGVGVELPLSGISVFLEARAHGVQTDATPYTYIPITVGIRF